MNQNPQINKYINKDQLLYQKYLKYKIAIINKLI